jgi:hypothetical protein
MTTNETTGPARNYPLPQLQNDHRFTTGLLLRVGELIEAHGYPPLTTRDVTELGAALFTVLYSAEPAATEAAPEPEPVITHHAVMRHGVGDAECGTRHVWELMTRAWKDVTCPDCLAALDEGAPERADTDPSDYVAIERGAQIDAAVGSTGHLPGYFDADSAPDETRWLEPSLGPCPHCLCPTDVHSVGLGCVLCDCIWGREAQR